MHLCMHQYINCHSNHGLRLNLASRRNEEAFCQCHPLRSKVTLSDHHRTSSDHRNIDTLWILYWSPDYSLYRMVKVNLKLYRIYSVRMLMQIWQILICGSQVHCSATAADVYFTAADVNNKLICIHTYIVEKHIISERVTRYWRRCVLWF